MEKKEIYRRNKKRVIFPFIGSILSVTSMGECSSKLIIISSESSVATSIFWVVNIKKQRRIFRVPLLFKLFIIEGYHSTI